MPLKEDRPRWSGRAASRSGSRSNEGAVVRIDSKTDSGRVRRARRNTVAGIVKPAAAAHFRSRSNCSTISRERNSLGNSGRVLGETDKHDPEEQLDDGLVGPFLRQAGKLGVDCPVELYPALHKLYVEIFTNRLLPTLIFCRSKSSREIPSRSGQERLPAESGHEPLKDLAVFQQVPEKVSLASANGL